MTAFDTPPAAVPTTAKVLYGLGGMADSIKSIASGLYLLFFYTSVLGVPGRLVGSAAALSLVWDSFIDPFIGRLSDRTQGRFGRRHGWMLVGSAGMAVTFFALFAPPAGMSHAQLFAWLLVISLSLRTSQSMFSVPYSALGAELHSDYDERTRVAVYRAGASQLGALIASGLMLAIFFRGSLAPSADVGPATYARMGATLGLLMGLAGALATAGTWSYHTRRSRADLVRPGTPRRGLLRNRAFLVLTASASLFYLAAVINASLSMHFLTYYAGFDGARIAACQFALHGGAIGGVIAWARIARGLDKHVLYSAGCLMTGALVTATFWTARQHGALADFVFPVLLIGSAAAGLAASGLPILSISMLADVAEDHELRSGEPCEGAVFGAFSCGQQIATGLAVALAAVLVDAFAGLVPGAAVQGAQTIHRIGVLSCLMCGALMIAAGLLILPYQLSRERTRAVQAELAQRAAAVR
jgi:GPH family glycoside/pentoside/hexuronide:cation symporter